jgi:CDP-glycerol glycerophosphotransferase
MAGLTSLRAPTELNPRIAFGLAAALPSRLAKIHPDLWVFDSWRGRFADSPRAMYDEIRRTHPDVRCVWVGNPDQFPADIETVTPHSRRHAATMAVARVIVTNHHLPPYYRKRAGAVCVQTWHGTPLKRIGWDILDSSDAANRGYLRTLRRDVPAWDLLLSPGAETTEVFRDAFGYRGLVSETGMPRNDVLVDSDPTALARLKTRLGLPTDRRLLLYAPTFRDDDSLDNDDFRRVANRLAAAVPAGWTVLLRIHANRADTADPTGQYLDVSDRPDAQDLLQVADGLVTDYSSVMFDFGVTGRPMIFYCPDYADYGSRSRGFYVDLAAIAPGPVTYTLDELATAAGSLQPAQPASHERYQAFRRRFCPHEDGHASRRAVEALDAALGSCASHGN